MNINEELKKLNHGGKVSLPAGQTDISEPVILDTPCTKIEGDVWCCNADPNGVFECEYGTKLRLMKNDIPAIYVGNENIISNIVFTSKDAKIIVSKDSSGTEFMNVPEERIVYQF